MKLNIYSMKNIKTYEDFCNENLTNEEINIKKALAGAALGAGLAFGSPAKGQVFGGEQTQSTQTINRSSGANILGVSIATRYEVFEHNIGLKGFHPVSKSNIVSEIPDTMRVLKGSISGKPSELHIFINSDSDIMSIVIVGEVPIDKPIEGSTTKYSINYTDTVRFLFESYNKLSKDKDNITLNLGKFHKQYYQGLTTAVSGLAITGIGALWSLGNTGRSTSTYNKSTGVETTSSSGPSAFPAILMVVGGITATVGGVIMIDSHKHLKTFDQSKKGDYEFK